MSLPAPNLDSRRFDDLLAEARARIPRYTPEWTNLNDSDPGMTLVKLHAWMTETILYELNRVPELNYVKFLDLLGVVPRPARPARTELTFALERLDTPDDPLTVTIPRLTKVAVDDPALPVEVVFETDRTLVGVNAAIGALIVPRVDGTDGAAQTRQLVSSYDNNRTSWPHPFDPLAGAPSGPPHGIALGRPAALYLGVVLRPVRREAPGRYAEDRFPAGPLDVYADAVTASDSVASSGAVSGGVASGAVVPGGTAGHVEWQVYVGDGTGDALFEDDLDDTGWARLALSEDGTGGLSGSGHLAFEMPATARPLDPSRLSPAFWASFGGVRPPRTTAELAGQLSAGTPEILEGLADFWELMGATPEQLGELAACGESSDATAAKILTPGYTLDPSRLALADWLQINGDYAEPLPATDAGYRQLYWIRGRVRALPHGAAPPVAMRGLHLNTAPATQAATRLDDRLGRSNARPAQVFTLPKAPVLIDPATGQSDLELRVAETGAPSAWVRVEDFHRSGPDDPHYLLDPGSGRITLGDGRRGRVPVAGAQVSAARYRVGGGRVGNVGAGVITRIKGRLRGVAGVTNPRPAHDGDDAETPEAVRLRAPHDLRTMDRAVSAEDFADLALRTPGVALHRAVALPRRAVAPDQTLVERDGAVTLLVLPVSDRPTPLPEESQKRAIHRWLEPRRLITTELHVVGPRYAVINRLSARLAVRPGFDLGAVGSAVHDALLTFLSPFTGGDDGTGWPFGQDVFYGDLYDRILAVDGVRRAWRLVVEVDGTPGDSAADVATVPEGHLVALSRAAIDLEVAYA